MYIQVTRSGKPMTQQLLDHHVIGSAFEQPRRERMPQVMEVQIIDPCPLNSFNPPMLKGVRILPSAKETPADSWHIAF
jgi:hypothetical protein